MVPTMSEYFGQWKASRFVAGDRASSESFNVVSRLSDIRDILTGLEVIYEGVEPAIGRIDEAKAAQTGRELTDLRALIAQLYTREQAGNRFTAEQAETLGTEAQERATAIAGRGSADGCGARCRDRAVASRHSPGSSRRSCSCRRRRRRIQIRGGWRPTCGCTSPTPSGR